MDFDETRLYYTHQQLQRDPLVEAARAGVDDGEDGAGETSIDHSHRQRGSRDDNDGDDNVNLDAVRRHFREFLREYSRRRCCCCWLPFCGFFASSTQARSLSLCRPCCSFSKLNYLSCTSPTLLIIGTSQTLAKKGNYRLGTQRYLYREKLLRMHRRLSATAGGGNNDEYGSSGGGGGGGGGNSDAGPTNVTTNVNLNSNAMLDIDVAHLGEYDGSLLGYLRDAPATILPQLEAAASDALDTLLYDLRQEGGREEEVGEGEWDGGRRGGAGGETSGGGGDNAATGAGDPTDQPKVQNWLIQILLKGNLAMTPLRSIKSQHMHKLIKCPGIVISSSPVQVRAVQLTIRCQRCLDTRVVTATEGPYGSVPLPGRCQGVDGKTCGANPYTVVTDESQFSDRQKLKLQEAPERVPTGEMPRSVMVAVEKCLVDRAPPGTRVAIFCIPTLFGAGGGGGGPVGGTQKVYLRCVGLTRDDQSGDAAQFTPAEEEAFRQLARRHDVYDILTRSIAPSIQGSYTADIKKALVCMLLGGTRKRLPDGLRLRGDINVLLLGDPSTAKSQFLKFVSKAAPVGVYTSGKGSSAAGLTASVVKNAQGEFYLEGGAMVLADGGIVCIDEFDKMRPQDRVAIHEAMEQQTISVAKAGITTVLNSRSAVLAAANPVFGRYDDFKSASENIDLMTTILSRFDLIFLVRDIREEERDLMICRHVMGVHIQNSGTAGGSSSSSGGIGSGTLGFLSASSILEDGAAESRARYV
jgi:DNA replication licensing factor MCM5